MADHPRETSGPQARSGSEQDPLTAVWRHAEGIAEVASDSEQRYAVLPLESDHPVLLTGTAASIWAALDGRRTLREVIDEMARRYDADGDAVREETLAFVSRLRGQRLVEAAPLGNPS